MPISGIRNKSYSSLTSLIDESFNRSEQHLLVDPRKDVDEINKNETGLGNMYCNENLRLRKWGSSVGVRKWKQVIQYNESY